jgi:hypothetical protein
MKATVDRGVTCSICGREVKPWEDWRRVHDLMAGSTTGFMTFVTEPHHFLPTATCHGDETAQYIEGQPRSSLQTYYTHLEPLYRRAYHDLLAQYDKLSESGT